jgi:hypothetical protein
MRLVATGPTLVAPAVDTDPGSAGSPASYQAGGAVQPRSTGYFKNPEDAATTLIAGKLLKILTGGVYPAGDGSALTGIVGTLNKAAKVFDIRSIGASFSTGALGFTPGVALIISSNLGGLLDITVGFHNDAVALTSQQCVSLQGGASVALFTNTIISHNGATEQWRISAFSSGGLTLTRTVGAATVDEGLLIIIEA